jgi:PKD repeat protein
MEKQAKIISILMLILTSAFALSLLNFSSCQPSTTLKIVDAATGSSSITVGSETEPIPKGGIPFTVKVVLEGGVTSLMTYQVGISYNSTAIRCANAWNPGQDPNFIFYGKKYFEAVDLTPPNEIVIGAVLQNPNDAVTTSSGILCMVNFTALKAGIFTFDFAAIGTDTFLLNNNGFDISFQTQSFTLTVKGSAAPLASFTWSPTYPKANETVTFNASSSYDSDGYIVSYIWDFGDGVTNETSNPIITHNFTKNGMYNVNLTVIDNDGLKDSIVQVVHVGRSPILILEPLNPKYMPNEEITFNASRSYDPDGYIVSYIWDFGDGQNRTTTDPITNKTYTKRGIYTVAIKIVDDDGLYNSTTLKIQIGNSPIANFTYTPKNPKVGEEVTFDASNVTLPDEVPLKTFVWYIEERNETIVKDASEGPLFSYTFMSADPGWNVTLTVIDEDGLYGSCSALVPVYAEEIKQSGIPIEVYAALGIIVIIIVVAVIAKVRSREEEALEI